jgi:hypothetical protein
MSQVVIPRIDRTTIVLFHDLYFSKKKAQVRSTVMEAACSICEKSLDEGISVTAKKTGMKLRFFCQYHLPKDY